VAIIEPGLYFGISGILIVLLVGLIGNYILDMEGENGRM
jgi:hypothetical protein